MLDILKHEVQYIALSIMAIVYITKIVWIMRFKPMVERTPGRGKETVAIITSFLSLAMPWTMESTTKKWYKWLEFAIFHIGIAVVIIASFLIPEAPQLMTKNVILIFKIIIALAFVIGMIRLGRRLFSPVYKLISHPDDYFSISMMIIWFFVAFFAMNMNENSWSFPAYFAMTALGIIYVPFSKMSHYILWPFSRYYFGKHFGHRGVYPKVRGSAV
jgi:nitrate reductase gamma subunit